MGNSTALGTWNVVDKMKFVESFKAQIALPMLLRVGMTPSPPWMFFQMDEKDGKKQRKIDSEGNFVFGGYCVDLLAKIAEKIGFEYEIVLSSDWEKAGYEYGKLYENGSWSGLVGDLASGNIDLVVADLTMTSEREESIDYVSPYFDQVLNLLFRPN